MKIPAAAVLLVLSAACARTPEFDIIVTGGTVYDGTGTTDGVQRLDVGIRGDRIASLGDLSGHSTRQLIDATGRAIAPGFIDVYGQSGTTLLVDGNGESHARQGITTEVIGDGGPAYWTASSAPAADRRLLARFNVTVTPGRAADYVNQLTSRGTSLNVATLVPASFVRGPVGAVSGALAPEALARMRDTLDRAMLGGAFGLSVEWAADGGPFGKSELIALARVIASHGGLLVATLSADGPAEDQIRHVAAVADAARLPFMIANLNLPSASREDGIAAAMPSFLAAAAHGISAAASVTGYPVDENDVRAAVMGPVTVVGTATAAVRAEGELSRVSMGPAAYGAFPRFLGEFVREKRVLELPEAIRRITGFPASQLHIARRGFIRENYFADLVIFDPNTIASPATAERPNQYPIGIDYVLVNGVLIVTLDGHTGAHPGRALLGPAARPSGR